MSDRIRGTVRWFDGKKGYGFIDIEGEEDKSVFVHYQEIKQEGFKSLNEGDRVEFGIQDSPKGPRAVEVEIVG